MRIKKGAAIARLFNRLKANKLVRLFTKVLLVAVVIAAIAIFSLVTEPSSKKVVQVGSNQSSGKCAKGVSLNIVAHEDDDILFMNPDIQRDINSGRCVTTLYVTSGDRNMGLPFVHSREEGVMSAYAYMANVRNNWQSSVKTFSGKPVTVKQLSDDSRISLLFMLLPTSDGHDGGYTNYKGQTLKKLQLGQLLSIKNADNTASYTASDVVNALVAIMDQLRPDTVRVQDYTRPYNDNPLDHSDHIASARFSLEANSKVTFKHLLIGYEDYPIQQLPPNLTTDQVKRKEEIWLAYAPYDIWVCKTVVDCQNDKNDGYYEWFSREYTVGTIPSSYTVNSPTKLAPNPL